MTEIEHEEKLWNYDWWTYPEKSSLKQEQASLIMKSIDDLISIDHDQWLSSNGVIEDQSEFELRNEEEKVRLEWS